MKINLEETKIEILDKSVNFILYGQPYDLTILDKQITDKVKTFICVDNNSGDNYDLHVINNSRVIFESNGNELINSQIVNRRKNTANIHLQVDTSKSINQKYEIAKEIAARFWKVIKIITIISVIILIFMTIAAFISFRKEELERKEQERIQASELSISTYKLLNEYEIAAYSINGIAYKVTGKVEITSDNIKIFVDDNYDGRFSNSEMYIETIKEFVKTDINNVGYYITNNRRYTVEYNIKWIKIQFKIKNDNYEIRASRIL